MRTPHALFASTLVALTGIAGCNFDLDALRERASDGQACRGNACDGGGGSGGQNGGDAGDSGSAGEGGSGGDSGGEGGESGNGGKGGSGGKGGGGSGGEPDVPDMGKCLEDHGGCDVNANCIEADDPDDDPTCDCKSGFAGNGTSCEPAFIELGLSAGTITPALDPDVTTYNVVVPISTERLVFTPSAVDGVTIVLNDDAIVESGDDWRSPVLDLGFNSFTATLQLSGHDDRDYVFNVTRGKQEAYLKGDMLTDEAWSGYDVAVDGDVVVVGAPGDIWGNPTVPGSAYVFVRDGLSWVQRARLGDDAPAIDDFFGSSVAISGDTVVVGAVGADGAGMREGAVYVFTRSGDTWTKQARLKASNAGMYHFFGADVAIDGDTLVAGAQFEGSVQQGISTTAATDNDASGSGAAYVFTRSGETWTQRVYLKASNAKAGDEFGNSVAISESSTAGTYWIAIGAASYRAANSGDGAFYVFRGSDASWTESTTVTSPAPLPGGYSFFGTSVDVDGDWIVVGASSEGTHGRAYSYQFSSGAWQPHGAFESAPGTEFDGFGSAVAISGRMIAVGAYGEDSSGTGVTASVDESANESGALYLFALEDNDYTWSQAFYVKADTVGAGDYFGNAVAIDGDTIAVGAQYEASNARSVDGDPDDNSSAKSGAAYVIR